MKKYYKKIIVVAIIGICCMLLSGCMIGNRQTGVDTVQTFSDFTIVLGDKVVEGKVAAWRDYENSDVIQITDKSGNVYLTHYMNVIMERRKTK